MKSTRLWVVTIGMFLLAAVGALAETVNTKIKMVQRDEFVTRIMRIIRKSGETIPGLATIDAYSPATKAFIAKDVSGGVKSISVSDIKRIEFEQKVNRQNSAAQGPVTIITAKAGRETVVVVPEEKLKIESGTLELEIQETSALPGNTVPSREIAELKTIEYDSARKAFVVNLQYFSYSSERQGGGGGSSGGGKGLH